MSANGRASLDSRSSDASLFVKALYSYSGTESASLSFERGDFIEVISRLPSGWWDGMIVPNKERGWFPSNYVVQVTEAEANWAHEQLEDAEEPAFRQEQTIVIEDAEREPRSRSTTAKPNKSNGVDTFLGINGYGGPDEASFSTGANIFREIAGAAAQNAHGYAFEVPITMSRRPSAASDTSSVAEDWIPRITGDGQIVYYNTRTGQTSRDMPQDLSPSDFHSARGSSSASPATSDGQNFDERKWGHTPGGLDMRMDVESLGTAATPVKRPTNRPPPLERRDSAYSDDSALDAAMQSSGKRGLTANKALPFVPETPTSTLDPSSGSSATFGRDHPLQALEPAAPPTLSSLEQKANDAISELIEAAHPRRRAGTEVQAEEAQDVTRESLSTLITRVIQDIRTLMMAADVFDASSSQEGSPQTARVDRFPPIVEVTALGAYQTEIRPFVRKVTSTLSKLVLSTRAVWGLMGTSAEEEVAFFATFDDPEVDQASLRAQRDETLKIRADTETKLKWDVVDGAREVADSLIKFIDEVERLLASPLTASTLTPRIDRATLPAVKRPTAVLRLHATASVPGAGQGGHWRGNGFAGVAFPSAQSSSSAASTSLADAALVALNAEALRVKEEVASMRSLMNAIVAKSNKRMSVASSLSSSTSGPNTPANAPPVQPQPSYTPVQSAARHMTKISTQTTAILTALGDYLSAAEDIDIAGRVEFDLVPSLVPELRKTLNEGQIAGKGKGRAFADGPLDTYASSMQKAAPLLNGYERAKQALYDASPALLMAIHSIGLTALTEGAPEVARTAIRSRSQPPSDDPLTAFVVPPIHADPLASINAALGAVDAGVGFLLEGLQGLLAVSREQEQIPTELRERARQIRRTKIAPVRASTYSIGLPTARQSAQIGASGLGLKDDDARSETSSMQSDLLSGIRGVNGMGVDPYRQRDSFPSSLSSSRQDFYAGSMPMTRSNTEPSSAGSSEASPQLHFSPSNKLRKFFGDDAPPMSNARAGGSREEMPSWLAADYEDEMSYNAEGLVKGGTLRALVARLTSHLSSDHAFMTIFLMTYRTFATSVDLFNLLVARYTLQYPPELNAAQRETWQQKKQLIIQLRTINVLKIWIESHLWDDDADVILHSAFDFGSRMGGRNAQQILKVVHTRRVHGSKRIAASLPMAPPPPSISLRSSKRVKFLDIDPLEMARQLTLMDSRLCARITARECLSKAWPKRLGTETDNISQMTSLGNAITNWVVDAILRQEDVKKRVSAIKHFVLIADRCRDLQNFSTLIHIVAGLYTTPIHRLRRTWDMVNQRTMATLQELNTLMSPTRNFAEYRETIRTVGPPCVPFLGVFLTSWTFIGDGNPDFLRERPEQINFNKRQKAAELVQQIQLHQSTPYNLADVQGIKQYLETVLIAEYDEQVFYAMSLALEPKEREDDRVARLLSESGFL